MPGAALDLGELVAPQVELDHLGLMGEAGAESSIWPASAPPPLAPDRRPGRSRCEVLDREQAHLELGQAGQAAKHDPCSDGKNPQAAPGPKVP